MREKYIITNTWTHARHGHAHDELLSIKNFLSFNSIQAQILSVDYKFGDLRIRSLGRTLQNLHLHHSRIFKPLVDSSYGRDLSRGLKDSLLNEQISETSVVVTSSRFQHLLKLGDSLKAYDDIRIRILDAPKNRGDWESLAKFLSRLKNRSTVAMEVKDSVVDAEKYLDNIIYVPSHFAMQTESVDTNKSRNKVGVFWPVGRSFSTSEVLSLLNQVKVFDPIVKLPSHMEASSMKLLYPKIEFIEAGLGVMQFREILSRIKVAILGHRGYTNQSSGYAGYFLANNVPIFASNSNSFFGEIKELGLVYSLESNLDHSLGLITKLFNGDLNLARNPYAIFVEESWKTFLLEEKI